MRLGKPRPTNRVVSFRFRCAVGFLARWLAVKRNSLFRVTRRAVSGGPLKVVRLMRSPRLPFAIIVSRLLSNPDESAFHLSLTLLDTLSDLDLYLALGEEYLPYSHYTLKQCYYASNCSGSTRLALCRAAASTAL